MAQKGFCTNCGSPKQRDGYLCEKCIAENEKKRYEENRDYRLLLGKARTAAIKAITKRHQEEYEAIYNKMKERLGIAEGYDPERVNADALDSDQL